ncbi:hypothetical protein HOK68_00370 [Candidatus Woesearchaeota archaeon]|jgi:adenylate kinase family enzyme|nr:hypothetical protein [Candidatus Woesearchaeota archaeon]MBT4387940.1 hypothetical protein [Candidatus Woesearchaeota archaeon]MBT4595758.1 hypothetical protein [Candidatus Woesearchaeota archaeon]MBT5741393.1 hypothetical protein [Candidatus Woesearchaeota archaeon]MBT6505215.1 hypothetical protein [Candidatus Woesearchaeota archaeon]
MKLIILDGMPTVGKTTLGRRLKEELNSKLTDYKIFYFNDDIKNKYNIDIFKIVKDQDLDKFNLNGVTTYLNSIINQLSDIEKKEGKDCIFIIDRFHMSYLPYAKSKIEEFHEFEKSFNEFTFYGILGFDNLNPELLHDRLKGSLNLRKDHGFNSHFERITTDPKKGNTPKERLFTHYEFRNNLFKEFYNKTSLQNKLFIPVDNISLAHEYDDVFQLLYNKILRWTHE